jgi:hypothetical protein
MFCSDYHNFSIDKSCYLNVVENNIEIFTHSFEANKYFYTVNQIFGFLTILGRAPE